MNEDMKQELEAAIQDAFQGDNIEEMSVEMKTISPQKCKSMFGHAFEYIGGGSGSSARLKHKTVSYICRKCKKKKRFKFKVWN